MRNPDGQVLVLALLKTNFAKLAAMSFCLTRKS